MLACSAAPRATPRFIPRGSTAALCRPNAVSGVRRHEGVNDRDEVAKRVREGFVPLISEHRGFVAYYHGDASEEGVIFSISVFEDQADAEDSNRLAADFVKENLAELMPNPPMTTTGHVRAQS
jgi:hypothetical protein